jgi:16S rRNA (guanine527-N7)-methyltransferase
VVVVELIIRAQAEMAAQAHLDHIVQQVAASLRLSNLKGVHARVETLEGPFDVIGSRAFASLPDFVTWSANALGDKGVWMAMKGKLPEEEISSLPSNVQVFHVEQLHVPGLNAERCMIWMKKSTPLSA